MIKDGQVIAYPNKEINKFDPARPTETLGSVQSVVVDARNRLWILDTAAPKFSTPIEGAAKLVAVDLSTDKVVKTIVFPRSTVLSTTYINDVRFDLREGKEGVAYITDSSVSGPGGIIVVDLASGESWRKLTAILLRHQTPHSFQLWKGNVSPTESAVRLPHRSTWPLMASLCLQKEKPCTFARFRADHLYSIPTSLLLDRSVNDEAVAKAVVDLGEKGASDGLESDDKGRVYAGDYEHNGIRQRQSNGEWKTIVHDPRVLWPTPCRWLRTDTFTSRLISSIGKRVSTRASTFAKALYAVPHQDRRRADRTQIAFCDVKTLLPRDDARHASSRASGG